MRSSWLSIAKKRSFASLAACAAALAQRVGDLVRVFSSFLLRENPAAHVRQRHQNNRSPHALPGYFNARELHVRIPSDCLSQPNFHPRFLIARVTARHQQKIQKCRAVFVMQEYQQRPMNDQIAFRLEQFQRREIGLQNNPAPVQRHISDRGLVVEPGVPIP